MREAAEDDKNMENRVHIAALYAESVEYRAERVEHAARDKQYKAHEPQRAVGRHDGKDYAPSGGGSFFGQTDGIVVCAYCTKNNAYFCTMCYIGRKYKKGLDF